MKRITLQRLQRLQQKAAPRPSRAATFVTYAADPGFAYRGNLWDGAEKERTPLAELPADARLYWHIVNGPAPNGYVLDGDTSADAVALVESGRATGVTPRPEGYPHHTIR